MSGFMQSLMEGVISQVAPAYFNAMKQQEQDAAKTMLAKKQAEEISKQANSLIDPLMANEQDPRKKGLLQSHKNLLMSQNALLLEHPEKIMEQLYQYGLMSLNPTDKIKEAEYTFNDALPENQREMVRQRAMGERPADIQERAIKQQNADTLSSYRKAQTSGAVPGISGRGKLMANGMPLPKVKPGERYNPNTDQVEVLPGSDLERVQSEKHSEAASKVSTIVNVADNMIATGKDLLNDEGFSNLFGKGDIVTGAIAHGTQFLSPGAMAKLEQFKNELKTQGGALYKEIANSPGSMQVAEWPILEGQLATLKTGMPEPDAKKIIQSAIDFVQKAKQRKQELYAEQYADTPYYNPDISGESKSNLPPELEGAFTSRRGLYRYSSDSGMRKSIVDGSISINNNGKWVPAELIQDGKGGFTLTEKVENKQDESTSSDSKKAELEQLRKELSQ